MKLRTIAFFSGNTLVVKLLQSLRMSLPQKTVNQSEMLPWLKLFFLEILIIFEL